MVGVLTDILAKSSDDSAYKLIGFAVVAAFWIIGAIVSAVNKRAEEAKRRRQFGQMPEDVAFPVPPPMPYPAQVRDGGKGQKRSGGKKKQRAVAVVAAAPPVGTSLRERMADTPTDEPPARKKQGSAANAGQIGRLLRRKDSLRAAFILNEVMSKPLAMREVGERH